MDIYTNATLYDAIHKQYRADIDFISGWAAKIGGPILELAAGTGRLGLPLVQAGYDYTGLELSPNFVQAGNAKLSEYPKGKIIEGDMQSFDLGQQFQFIFIGFNSFLHNLTDDNALGCLTSVREHLKHNGTFLVSVFIPDPYFLYRDKNKLYPVMNHFEFEGQTCTIKETNLYDEETEVNHLTWFLFRDRKKDPKPYSFDLRLFYPDTMDRLITDAGLAIYEKLGDYENNPLSEDSALQIYICGR